MFCCLFISDFSAEAILRFEPEVRTKAVVVLAGRAPLERVVGMNENARQLGVETGALKAQLEASEELVLRSRSESLENSAHAALLDCAQSFSPEVEDTAPNAVLVNLAGLEPLFGSPSQIIYSAAERAWQMGLKINVAAAANPDAAFLAAHGFSGVTLITEGFEAQRLGGLPVDALFETFSDDAEQAARWLETFDRWGVRNLRALAALPEVPVSERLGQEGLRLQKLARGAISRKLRLFEPQPVFEESIELEYPIVLLEPLAFLLNRMLEQVCARLEARALAAQELRLTLELTQKFDPEISEQMSLCRDPQSLNKAEEWSSSQPRRGGRMQPTAQAVGSSGQKESELRRSERNVAPHTPNVLSEEADDAAIECMHEGCADETCGVELQDTSPEGASYISPAPRSPARPLLACRGGGLQRWEKWNSRVKSRRDDRNDCSLKPRFHTFTRTLRLPVPMLNAKTFLKLLQLDLQAHPPGAPIVKIHLSAEPARARTAQSGLFQPVFPEPEKLELTLARIEGIVGEGRVGSAELLDTHQEGAFEMRHFAPGEPEEERSLKNFEGKAHPLSANDPAEKLSFVSGHRFSGAAIHSLANAPLGAGCGDDTFSANYKTAVPSEVGTVLLETSSLQNSGESEDPVLEMWDGHAQEKMSAVIALRLFRPPLRAVVNVCEGKPVKLKCIPREDICGDIVWSAGPWRSSGDWSEQEGWSRDEWDVAVPIENGLALYRLVEDRLSRGWFVEGAYD